MCAGGCAQRRGRVPGQQVPPSPGLEPQLPRRGRARHNRYLRDLLACSVYGRWDPDSLHYSEDPRVVKYSGVAAVKRRSQQRGVSLTFSESEWLPVLGFVVLQAPVLELGWKLGG